MVRLMCEGVLARSTDVAILWGTGTAHLAGIRDALGALGNPIWVRAVDYFHDMPRGLDAATLAVSRAGAMATSELLAWGIPSILVPLPTAAADHQSRNAESLETAGAALHLPESALSGESLWQKVHNVLSHPERLGSMRRAALDRARPDATMEIARHLTALLPGRKGGSR
jgi:UDP-N-acetylglucosamine--N-acetylmuramyl-(pentapeptide) pyrophosphoryl-undecaprenol N-acetylglucosamine transferase